MRFALERASGFPGQRSRLLQVIVFCIQPVWHGHDRQPREGVSSADIAGGTWYSPWASMVATPGNDARSLVPAWRARRPNARGCPGTEAPAKAPHCPFRYRQSRASSGTPRCLECAPSPPVGGVMGDEQPSGVPGGYPGREATARKWRWGILIPSTDTRALIRLIGFRWIRCMHRDRPRYGQAGLQRSFPAERPETHVNDGRISGRGNS